MSVMDVRRLVRALGVGAMVLLFLGGGIGLVAAGGGNSSGETWTVAAPAPGDRATYRVADRVVDRSAADPQYGVGPGMRLDVEWLPARDMQAVDSTLRHAHLLATTLRYEGRDWESNAEVAFDAAGWPLSRSVEWESRFGGGSSTVSVMGVGSDPERRYEGRREEFQGPLAPCGVRADLQGRAVVKGDRVTVFGGCEDDEAHAAVYTVRGWDTVDGRRLLRLDSPTGLRLHYDPALPVPVRVEAHMREMWTNPDFLAGRLTILRLDAFHDGGSAFPPGSGGAPPVDPPPAALAATTPWLVDDGGVEHPFRLSAAYAAAMDPANYGDDEQTVPQFLARHPRAYLAFAWGEHLEDARGTSYEGWALLWTDGDAAIGKQVVLYPFALYADVPGLPRSPVVTEWDNDVVDRADDLFPTPAAVPGSLPALADVWDRAAAVLRPFGLAPNSYGAAVYCGRTCQEADLVVMAGYTRTPANRLDAQAQDQQGIAFLLALDGSGRLESTFRVDSRTEAPLPVLPANPSPAGTPQGQAAPAAASLAWGLPTPEAVASVGMLASLAAALYYFWPTVKAGALGLFSRIQPDRVLEHPSRRNLYAMVEGNPGIHFQELARRTGFGRGQLEHHLRKLQAANLVSRVQGDSYACFFARGQVDHRVMVAAPLLRSEGGRSILGALRQRPGASSRELAAHLGLAAGTVSYHVKRLREAGLLESMGGALHLTEIGWKAGAVA